MSCVSRDFGPYDRLLGGTDSFGNQTTITYALLTDPQVYQETAEGLINGNIRVLSNARVD